MVFAVALFLLTTPALPDDKKDNGKRTEAVDQTSKAAQVFREIMDTPDKNIPKNLLDSASCVAVFPSVFKGGFIVGASHGRGVVSCRTAAGRWSNPLFIDISGGSIGLQIGGEAVDLVLLGMNPRTIDLFTKDRFKIGGEANAAAGPVGRATSAETDLPTIRSEILTYSRARGLFAGLEIKGSVIRREKDLNHAVYGAKFSPTDVLKTGNAKAYGDISVFPSTLAKYSSGKNLPAAK
jgi:lipid-binding SYLF domain-containing protein